MFIDSFFTPGVSESRFKLKGIALMFPKNLITN
jgi:hypothetical protein